MPEQTLVTAVAALISWMLIWMGYFYLYGRYRTAVYEEALALWRDRLFDMPAAGHIPFTHPAYTLLCRTFENAWRNSRQIYMSDVAVRLMIHPGKSEDMASYRNRWFDSLQDLDGETKKRLDDLRDALHKIIGHHVSFAMPLLSLLTLFLANAAPLRLGWFSPIDVGVYMAVLQNEERQ